MKIHSFITLIAVTAILLTFTACDGNLASLPAPPVQNINREVIIVMPPLEKNTVLTGRDSTPFTKEVIPCR